MPHAKHNHPQECLQPRPPAFLWGRAQQWLLLEEQTQVGQERPREVPHQHMWLLQDPLRNKQGPLLLHAKTAYFSPHSQDGYYDADKTMIECCPIIPIEQHGIYANRVDSKLLKAMSDLWSPKFLLDSACFAELKLITQNTAAETCINEFYKTRDVRAAYLKLWLTFLGPGFTQRRAGQLEEELRFLKYKGEYRNNNFQTYIAWHKKIYQLMQNLKTNGYAAINFGTRVRYFLGGIKEHSLKTDVQICESQDHYSVDFQACASYLTTMV